MAVNSFTFNGTSSATMGIEIEAIPRYVTAQKIVESWSIPGRNGAVLRDTGAYANASVSYDVYFKPQSGRTVKEQAREIARWLQSPGDYARLTDTYESGVYRLAICVGPQNIEDWMLKYGRATITFTCRPERFLTSGETAQSVTSGTNLNNTHMPSRPLIQFSGNGTLNVGSSRIVTSGLSGTIYIDCETMQAYNGNTNLNSKITVTGGFPVLGTGNTSVTFSGLSSVRITPRWWDL